LPDDLAELRHSTNIWRQPNQARGHMRRPVILLLASVVAGCSSNTTPTPSAGATIQWDSSAANEARASVERGVRAFEAMNSEGVKAELAETWVTPSYDTDMENKPLRMATYADGVKYVEDTFAAVKKMGATLKIKPKNIACRGTSTLAFCVMDHEITATLPDGKGSVQQQQATIVLGKGAAGWKWLHFHSSPAGTPTETVAGK